jgi:hypothetical protein
VCAAVLYRLTGMLSHHDYAEQNKKKCRFFAYVIDKGMVDKGEKRKTERTLSFFRARSSVFKAKLFAKLYHDDDNFRY